MANTELTESSVMISSGRDEFSDYRLKHVVESGPLIIALPAVFNLFMLLADCANIKDPYARYTILGIRVIYTVLLVFLMFRLRTLKSFGEYAAAITILEIAGVAIFLFVFWQYPTPDFMIQTLGMITLILGIFLLPNLIVNMIAIVAGSGFLFLMCAWLRLRDLSPMYFAAGTVYIMITSVLCTYFAWNTQKSQRSEFAARQELQRMSSTDHLTQATTRFKLEEEAERWMVFCRRQGIPLSLVFVDVDDLKKINDRHGHLFGDRVLSEIVNRINGHLQESDIVARWGGDEFVLLLPDSDLQKAVALSESMRDSIMRQPVAEKDEITCSFGVVSMDSKATFETMVRDADVLMYKSKHLGKNRVEHA